MMAIKAALEARAARSARSCWCRNSAHGTNPATAALLGYRVVDVPARADGTVDPDGVKSAARPGRRRDHADQPQHLRPVRARRGGDRRRGARGRRLFLLPTAPTSTPSSARCGRAISASTPCTSTCTRPSRRRMAAAARAPARWCSRQALAPFAPVPFVVPTRTASRCVETRDGRRRQAFRPHVRLPRPDGHVRARASLHAGHGADGMRQASEDAVLNANYVRAGLRDLMSQPFGDQPCMHEVLFDDRLLEGHRRHHARFRQGDDRRGLSSDDDVFPAGRPRRHADRADRDRRSQGLARPLHRRAARPGPRRQARRHRALHRAPCSPRAAASTKPAPRASRCCAGRSPRRERSGGVRRSALFTPSPALAGRGVG